MELTNVVSALPPPDSPPEPLPHNKEGLVKFALHAHRQFDVNIWQKNPQAQIKTGEDFVDAPSYHNHNHVEAMIKATKALITACKERQDPLELRTHLAEWNARYPGQELLTLDDLETAFEIASAGHDLGNITKLASVTDQNGLPVLDFSEKYEAAAGTPDIETRSADIIEKLIDHFFTTPEDKVKIAPLKPLIRHLILQTVFNPQIVDFGQPFWQFMQYCDQIGTYYFSNQSRSHAIAGLLNEMRVHNDPPANLDYFLNFPEKRAEALIDVEKTRSDIIAVLKASGGKESNLISKEIFENTERSVDYLPDITTLLT